MRFDAHADPDELDLEPDVTSSAGSQSDVHRVEVSQELPKEAVDTQTLEEQVPNACTAGSDPKVSSQYHSESMQFDELPRPPKVNRRITSWVDVKGITRTRR